MTTTISSTDPVADAAPVTLAGAVDEAIAAAPVGSSDHATSAERGAGADAEDSAEAEPTPAPASAAPARSAPAGATDLADVLRAARASQRRADGTDQPAAPAPAPQAATIAAAAPAHPELETPPAEPAAPAAEAPATAEPATSYEAFVAGLSQPQRDLVEGHISGLKTALQGERATVKKLETQLRVTQATSDARTQLEADLASAQADAATAQQRATFYETAIEQGVRRTSVRLAYLAALDGGHIGEDGAIAWDTMRRSYADLFEAAGRTAPTPPSRSSSAAAGAGARQDTPVAPSLNQIIRNAAGRR